MYLYLSLLICIFFCLVCMIDGFHPKRMHHRHMTLLKGKTRNNFCKNTACKLKSDDASKDNEAIGQANQEQNAKVPFRGIAGYEANSLFEDPIIIPDSATDFSDLPGEEGSPERINAIQQKIQRRIDELAQSKNSFDQDDDIDQSFGNDPLTKYSLIQLMTMQASAAKIFDSPDEFLLNFTLVVITIVFLGSYTIGLEYFVGKFIAWFLNTDFDSDYLQNLLSTLKQ